jgi:hypothetical protein
MHRSSESIGTIAGALAKAQAELTNPGEVKALGKHENRDRADHGDRQWGPLTTVLRPFPVPGGKSFPFSQQCEPRWCRDRPAPVGPGGQVSGREPSLQEWPNQGT